MTDKNEKFERFGKYLILDHLVDGGMAKICRARYLGEQADKLVAIKMVQAQYSKDPNFVKMFEDELKVTFGLQHPNIAQTYDYGKVNGQLFTAMELVDGKNLKEFQDRLKKKNFVFPVEISTYIISQVCQALQYAHTFADKMTGKKLNIIHRDISPHNIMLTYDGAVKVIDFGIAKADSNSEATQAGTIKGKLSYLAPEYLDGLDLDPSYDQFAVGITFWEMLCNRKLFKASNDLAVLKQVQACKIPPPSSINPHVPKELDEIILKALSKDRSERFDDMDKFNRALVRFLYSKYPNFNATDLVYFSEQLFKDEIIQDKKRFVEYGKIDILPFINELKNDTSKSEKKSEEFTRSTPRVFDIQPNQMETSGIELNNETRNTSLDNDKNTGIKNNINLRNKTTKNKISRKTSVSRINRKPRGTRKVKKTNGPLPKIIAASILFIALYSQRDLISNNSTDNVSANTTREIGSDESFSNKDGTINLIGYDSDMLVFLNNKKVNLSGLEVNVPIGEKFNLKISKFGFKSYEKKGLYLTKEQASTNFIIPTLEREQVGLLSTSQNFTTGSKLIFELKNGLKFEKNLPLENERIPAGIYEGVIQNPLLGTEKKVKFEIEVNKRIYLD